MFVVVPILCNFVERDFFINRPQEELHRWVYPLSYRSSNFEVLISTLVGKIIGHFNPEMPDFHARNVGDSLTALTLPGKLRWNPKSCRWVRFKGFSFSIGWFFRLQPKIVRGVFQFGANRGDKTLWKQGIRNKEGSNFVTLKHGWSLFDQPPKPALFLLGNSLKTGSNAWAVFWWSTFRRWVDGKTSFPRQNGLKNHMLQTTSPNSPMTVPLKNVLNYTVIFKKYLEIYDSCASFFR